MKKLKIMFFIFLITLLSGCQDDEYFAQNQTAEPIITKTLSFEDLQEIPGVMDALSNFNLKKNGVAEKPVYNTTNDFWVDTDRVLYRKRRLQFIYISYIAKPK